MSTSPDLQSEWNFRIIANREIIVKAKSETVRKVSVIDILTKLPFPLETPKEYPIDALQLQKNYFAIFKIYTRKNVKDVGTEFIDFFTSLDVDQTVEDFFKAYWLYPNYIKFELDEAESL